ncbi:hypothetical protein CEXT_32721 [Caerostris extrusa]|uniref:Uncharacterized protein n=1 Tax=Caerostris extrusa TaxID=172846 RepID=A0AAV4SHN3_CAEEX|nr:hypothetical protein CEXT_32721 [Caerostris extrusa]
MRASRDSMHLWLLSRITGRLDSRGGHRRPPEARPSMLDALKLLFVLTGASTYLGEPTLTFFKLVETSWDTMLCAFSAPVRSQAVNGQVLSMNSQSVGN